MATLEEMIDEEMAWRLKQRQPLPEEIEFESLLKVNQKVPV
ncbi:hypothetical protein [Microaerobacter geothermalis]|nr:hypothetical protein [Microaerobacter geothermalis]